MQVALKTARGSRVGFVSLIFTAALAIVLSGCSGGNGTTPPTTAGNGGTGPAPTLSCAGYPKTVSEGTQVCLMTQQSVAATSSLSVTTDVGDLLGHGRDNLTDFTLSTQILATAADEAAATALAKTVVVTAANGAISQTHAPVNFPENLSVNFEVFTAPTTNLTLTNSVGDQSVDNYNATLYLKAQTGSLTLETVDGQATVNVATGNITATLSGTGWTGAGMTATSQTGSITVTRPAGYEAAFTAKADLGNATIDSQVVASGPQGAAVVTSGTGAPISIESVVGNATVTMPTAKR